MATPERLKRIARTFAGYLVNTIILLVVLNAVLGLFFLVVDASRGHRTSTNPIAEKYPNVGDKLLKLYPSMTKEDVGRLLWETWVARTLRPDLYTGFAERRYRGKFVNVSEHGFREGTDQAPWPPVHDGKNYVVFLFGGSTTFGYGVTDSQALGSQLQPLLAKKLGRPVSVYNFGQGCYFSTQERLLFEKLLLSGQRPDMAIFVDGLNDFQSTGQEVACTWAIPSTEVRRPTWRSWVREGIRLLPMTRLADTVHRKLHRSEPEKAQLAASGPAPKFDERGPLLQVIDTYFTNKRMIEAEGKEFSVRTLFVWQPVSTYEYDLNSHLFTQGLFELHLYSKYGYPLMQDAVKRTPPANFTWCADMQKDLHEPLYVDGVHYSPKMTGMVANCIVQGVQ
jgi:hypothetical protein